MLVIGEALPSPGVGKEGKLDTGRS